MYFLTFTLTPDSDTERNRLGSWDNFTDVCVYSGEISPHLDKHLVNFLQKNSSKNRIMFFLATHGGDPHAAYRIARFLQWRYESFTLVVMGECKSAGTLLALGADEIVMGPQGELGPLDMQLFRPDEFIRHTSALVLPQALSFLGERLFETFEKFFLALREKSAGLITTSTASKIASSLSTALFCPISKKIDPMVLGEMQRDMHIATYYAERLGTEREAAIRLMKDYPSHSFVIDFMEAESLLKNVRMPHDEEDLVIISTMNLLKERTGTNVLQGPFSDGLFAMVSILAQPIEQPQLGEPINESEDHE